MTLDWKPPEDDGGEPVQYYEVERQDARDGIWVPVGTTAEPHMVVDGLAKGAQYKFRVKVRELYYERGYCKNLLNNKNLIQFSISTVKWYCKIHEVK